MEYSSKLATVCCVSIILQPSQYQVPPLSSWLTRKESKKLESVCYTDIRQFGWQWLLNSFFCLAWSNQLIWNVWTHLLLNLIYLQKRKAEIIQQLGHCHHSWHQESIPICYRYICVYANARYSINVFYRINLFSLVVLSTSSSSSSSCIFLFQLNQ